MDVTLSRAGLLSDQESDFKFESEARDCGRSLSMNVVEKKHLFVIEPVLAHFKAARASSHSGAVGLVMKKTQKRCLAETEMPCVCVP
ncbi:hypothetical protein FF1_038488 [Malus domestica]